MAFIFSSFPCFTLEGYHYINLKNELNQPLLLPSLLVYTEAQDYIPNEHQGTDATSITTLCTTQPTRAT